MCVGWMSRPRAGEWGVSDVGGAQIEDKRLKFLSLAHGEPLSPFPGAALREDSLLPPEV